MFNNVNEAVDNLTDDRSSGDEDLADAAVKAWKEFFPKGAKRHYMISNLGRVASFDKGLHIDGYLLKISKGASVSGAKIALKVYEKGEEYKILMVGEDKLILLDLEGNVTLTSTL
jgi:hypothetical protein